MAGYSGRTRIRLASSIAVGWLLTSVSASATVAVRPVDAARPTATATQPAPPGDTIFVQDQHLTRPALLAEGVAALDEIPTEQGWRAAWHVRGLSFGEMLGAAARAPMIVPIAIVGAASILAASLARRRRRRRLGWGVLPERQRVARPRI